MSTSLDEQKTIELIKQAMIELLEERKDLFYELFAEAVEDTLLVNAIREGESTDTVNKRVIIDILEA